MCSADKIRLDSPVPSGNMPGRSSARVEYRVHILLTLSIAMAVCIFTTTGHCSQVEFRFKGQITEVDNLGNPSFILPAEVAVGNPTVLELSFEPIIFPEAAKINGPFVSQGGSSTIQPTEMKLSIGDVLFSDAEASIFVSHDQLGASTGGPADIIMAESIDIRGEGSAPVQNEILWRTDGGFANIGSVLDGGELLSDQNTWNLLPLRSMAVHFRANP